MDYQKHYTLLIEKNKASVKSTYTEEHHILPKCLGGNNSKDNLVHLSYREHFVAHWLLCKIHPKNFKLKAAFARMLNSGRSSSYHYDVVKRNLKDVNYPWLHNSEPWNKGKKNVQIPWNKGKSTGPMCEEQKLKISETLSERYKNQVHHLKGKPGKGKGTTGLEPWNKGKKTPRVDCEHCGKNVDVLNYKKWHGTKCKSRIDYANNF